MLARTAQLLWHKRFPPGRAWPLVPATLLGLIAFAAVMSRPEWSSTLASPDHSAAAGDSIRTSAGDIRRLRDELTQKQQSDRALLVPTAFPAEEPLFLADVVVAADVPLDLASYLPAIAYVARGLLNDFGMRVRLGEQGNTYDLTIRWSGRVGGADSLYIRVEDPSGTPVAAGGGQAGFLKVPAVPGGSYRIVLDSADALAPDFSLTAQAEWVGAAAAPVLPAIPQMSIEMSAAAFRSWDTIRAAAEQIVAQAAGRGPDAALPEGKVNATLRIGNAAASTVRVGQSGVVFRSHYASEAPSFSIGLTEGAAILGMTDFKLYSIRSKQGLLNYVANTFLADAGVFVARSRLVNVSLNGRNLGLYLVEEASDSSGFFSGVHRDDGAVYGNGRLFVDRGTSEVVPKEPLTPDLEVSRELATDHTDRRAFGRALAFVSAFSGNHGLNPNDFRLYRSPFTEAIEPVIRDMDIEVQRDVNYGARAPLRYSGWWLGPRLGGEGWNFRAKEFPSSGVFVAQEQEFTETSFSLDFGSAHLAVWRFMELAEDREWFDRYLLAASDPATQARFKNRLMSVRAAAEPFLLSGEYYVPPWFSEGATSDADWVDSFVAPVLDGFATPKVVPAMMGNSTILTRIVPVSPDLSEVFVYNLSAFPFEPSISYMVL